MSSVAGESTSQSSGLGNWLMANNVETVSSIDEIYRYDRKQQQDMLAAKPWEKEYVKFLIETKIFKNNLLNS